MITQPEPGEFAAYHQTYLELVPQGDLCSLLQDHFAKTLAFLSGIPEAKRHYRYAEGKWSVQELVLHLIDTERVFAYRALCISRGENVSLPGFDENHYVAAAQADQRQWQSLLKEYEAVRAATIALFDGMSQEMSRLCGTANQNPLSARAAGFILIGHEIHHLRILSERYL